MSEDTFGKEYNFLKQLLGIETTLRDIIVILDNVDPSLRYNEHTTVRGMYKACLEDIMEMCKDELDEPKWDALDSSS